MSQDTGAFYWSGITAWKNASLAASLFSMFVELGAAGWLVAGKLVLLCVRV